MRPLGWTRFRCPKDVGSSEVISACPIAGNPSPRGQGATGCARRRPRELVYPRVCGEPKASLAMSAMNRVYPRVCGGTQFRVAVPRRVSLAVKRTEQSRTSGWFCAGCGTTVPLAVAFPPRPSLASTVRV